MGIVIGNPILRHSRNFQQDVEVIRHHAIRQHPATTEILIHPHKHPERLPLVIPKPEFPVHHPRDTVIYRGFCFLIRPVSHFSYTCRIFPFPPPAV